MATVERDFMPDADALVDRRSSPLAGLLVASVAALVLAGLGWTAWAEVEEVVRAHGRIEPAGRVKVINHPRGGRVAAVHVAEGQRVATGAALVTFDPEVDAGQHAELLGRWQARAVETARLEAEAAGAATIGVDDGLMAARPDLVEAQAGLLRARAAALASRREALSRAVEARRGELSTTAAELARIRNGLVLLRQQLQAVRELAERGLYPRLKLVAVEREVGDAEGELAKTEAALVAARAALAESESRREGLDREWRSELLTELARSAAERDRLRELLRAQESLLGNMVVRAPTDGIVEAVAVTGPGQAVGPNDVLMKLVPVGDGLVVEARVANEDIGRIKEGMAATVKVRAYDYLRFGSLDGIVQKIASDASPEPRSGALAYSVTVLTDRQRLGDLPGRQEVVPGMVVDVELKVGARTILSYLTDRILLARDNAFRDG
jgi:HlyD family type I secretion membrane fusion protein